MQAESTRDKNALILYDPAATGQPRSHDFDPEHWRTLGQLTPTGAGRGSSWFVGGRSGPWVLRHYRRGGVPGRILHDTYLWTGAERSRPFAEWRLLAELHRRGLPVPQPIAARVIRRGVVYRGDILIRRLPGESLSARLQRGPLDAESWRAVGRCIRRFHDAGVWHADLNAHNILLDETGEVSLLDFDRGRLRESGAWKSANLARLARSLEKILAPEEAQRVRQTGWPELLNAYSRST